MLAKLPKVLSNEEIQTRLEEAYQEDNKQPVLPLDALGRKTDAVSNARRVTVMEDTILDFPELWLNVFVFGPEAGSSFNKLFARAHCYKADTPDDADLVVFTGSGHDIDPQLYGEKPHRSVNLNAAQDKAALGLFSYCRTRGIPMFGVCGGAQLLHVGNGGSLYQDVNGHNGAHRMWSEVDKIFIQKISSVHHQLCMPNERMDIIGTSRQSTERCLSPTDKDVGGNADIEAFWYRDTCCLGVQGHPEYSGYNKYTVWCLKQIDHYMNENPDLHYPQSDTGRNRLRVKQELLDEQAAKKNITVTIPSEDMILIEKVK